VQDQGLQPGREVGQAVHGSLGHCCAHLDVAQQCAFDGVLEANLPAQLAHLADIVQDYAGEQQVAIEDGVVGCDAVGQGEQADNVLQQAAQPGVMQLPGAGASR